MKHLVCECGGKTKTVRVTTRHFRAGLTFTLHDVEAEECPQCGERYFHASTIRQLDKKIDRQLATTDQ
jgi:YgiT-type zinc finger domain-containing protein